MNTPLVSLKAIITFRGGGTPSKKIAEYWNGDIPWATVKDFKGLKLSETQDCISTKGLHKSSANLIPKGHVIIPTRMALGKAAINTIDLAINQDLRALIPKGKIHTEYLLYALLSLSGEIEKHGSGATVKGITQENLYKLKIPLPTIDDQIRIATLLSRVEALIATRKDNLRLLDEFLKSTFLEMFGDPGQNEKGFEVRGLSEFYIDPKHGTKCGPFGSALKKAEYVRSGVPVWNMDNISVDGRLQPDVNLWVTDYKFEELKGYSAINGDVIISRAGTVGKMCVLYTDYPKSIISTNLIRVRFGKDLLPLYFVSLMTYCKGRVGKLRTGPDGAFTHMNTGILDKLRFPYPPIELQNQFATIVEKSESLKTLYQQSLSELENLYGALSQKAFKGDLDLNRIPLEKVAEETAVDAATESADQITKLDGYSMSDPAEREQLIRWLFDAFITEQKGMSFSLDDFWHQAEIKVVDHMDEESPPLRVADYDKAKAWLFDLLKSGQAAQHFNEEKNRMELSIKQ